MQFNLRTLMMLTTVVAIGAAAAARSGFDAVGLAAILAIMHVVFLYVVVSPLWWLLQLPEKRVANAARYAFGAVGLTVLICFAVAPGPVGGFAVWSFWPGLPLTFAASLLGAWVGWRKV